MLKEIQERFSCKGYKEEPIPMEALLRILKAGNLAPSPFNSQPWEFILATDQSKIKEIQSLVEEIVKKSQSGINKWVFGKIINLCKNHGFESLEIYPEDYKCPAMILVLLVKERGPKELSFPLNMNKMMRMGYVLGLGASIQNILIQAKKEGLDSCVTNHLPAVNQAVLKKIFGIPNTRELIAIITLGYGEKGGRHPKKLDADQVSYHNQFGNILISKA